MTEEHSLADVIDNLVHPQTQIHDHGIDLTVGAIYSVGEPGRLDFGGDELEDATLDPLETVPRNPDDEYEWWDLEGGQYVIQHNEFLSEPPDRLIVQPRNELLARGGSHPTVFVYDYLPLLPLFVPSGGLSIKENARISTLLSATSSDEMADEIHDEVT